METVRSTDQQILGIDRFVKEKAVVAQYFSLFNLGEYHQVAKLFAVKGSLYPPFEAPIVGQDEIAAYLIKEADGMRLEPSDLDVHAMADGGFKVHVRGKVTALVFKVSVTWCFILNENNEIESVRVDLLATLEELLKLRPNTESSSTPVSGAFDDAIFRKNLV